MPHITLLNLNMLYLKSGEFERTNELNESMGTFTEGDMVMALTASQAVTSGNTFTLDAISVTIADAS